MHLLNCSSTVICCTIFLILSLHQTQLLADSKNGNDDDKPKCRRARMKISVEYPSSSDGLKCNPIQTAVNLLYRFLQILHDSSCRASLCKAGV